MKKVYKVPIVIQLENVECGAACLVMLLAYFGKWVTLENAREECRVSRNGSNINDIANAAKKNGMEVHNYRAGMEHMLKYAKLPCMIHWNFDHFVILNGFKGNKAIITDPSQGRISISLEEFSESFTGIYMEICKGKTFEPTGKRLSLLEFIKRRIKNSRSIVSLLLLLSVSLSIIALFFPMFNRFFLDTILATSKNQYLFPMLVILGLMILARIILSFLSSVISLKIQGKYAIDSDYTFFKHLLRLPLSFFYAHLAGDLMVRQDSNRNIAYTLIQKIVPNIINLFLLVMYLFFMIQYNVYLTVTIVTMTLINGLLSYIIAKKRLEISQIQSKDYGKLVSETYSGLKMIETLKTFGSESGYFSRWSGILTKSTNSGIKNDVISTTLGNIPNFVEEIGNITVLILGAFFIFLGDFSTGMLLTFQGFVVSFTDPVNNLLSASQEIQVMRSSIERIEDVMRAKEDVTEVADAHHDSNFFELEIKNLDFSYSLDSEIILKNMNLKLSKGDSLAIVGESGNGKTTLVQLLSGVYNPSKGEINYYNDRFEKISTNEFRSYLSVVDQNIVLFNDTIENNLKLWDDTIDDEAMVKAAEDCLIHNVILDRKNGYQEYLKENGNSLSGGQRQCLEIARALARTPQLMILDEATSALDAQTEYKIMMNILNRGITLIVISHRLSAIRNCDNIVVLKNGQIVEQGSHDSLLEKESMYKKFLFAE